MKLRAPEGCASICHEGQIFVVEADGSIDVKKTMAAVFVAHGFQPWGGGDHTAESLVTTPSVDIEKFNRPRLFAFLRANGVRARLPITNKELRAAAREVLRVHPHVQGGDS